jgi:four helix bundle protein
MKKAGIRCKVYGIRLKQQMEGRKMGNFQELKVWQRAKDLAVSIHRVIESASFARDYCLKDQMWRSAISIPSNIAEGDELNTNKQSVKFFYIAKGSTAELLTQVIIAHEIGYLDKPRFDQIKEECHAISSMLARLITARSRS